MRSEAYTVDEESTCAETGKKKKQEKKDPKGNSLPTSTPSFALFVPMPSILLLAAMIISKQISSLIDLMG